MIRHKFHDLMLPALGLGCMRFPVDEGGNVRLAEVEAMIDYAMANGVNYFDTGYDYHSGKSEEIIGQILSRYKRESYFIADKFPGYTPRNWRRVAEIFENQLSRCKTDYFDFYLLHNVSESSIDGYLNPAYNIIGYLKEQKAQGRIKHLGFSAHGAMPTLRRLLEESDGCFEFAQIQLNYIDYEFQHAKEKIKLLAEYRLPIIVMEPLRGGRLAKPPEPYAEKISKLFPGMSPHSVAFRFVAGFSEVLLTLSGMSSLEQLKDNIDIFSSAPGLHESKRRELIDIAAEMTSKGTVPCTGCRYCTDACPLGLDIPRLIEYYNEHSFSGGGFIVPSAIAGMDRNKRPTACIGCRSCEELCPQGIKISEVMSGLCEKLKLK